ncbi:hypothetical protein [Burkholderia pseudomallei]|uniref:hypothetical protein n=1 Tax=Burkholderia pseudomallei TaxID=28450 RepID=UPI0006A596C7|nr:hypothetical protein [Burkholderia pseudomallei]
MPKRDSDQVPARDGGLAHVTGARAPDFAARGDPRAAAKAPARCGVRRTRARNARPPWMNR